MIRVLISAASAIVRAGLESLIPANPALEVVGTSADFATLGEQVEALQPDVVLLVLDAHDEEPLADRLADLALGERHDLSPSDGAHIAASELRPAGVPALVVLADGPQGTWIAEALRCGVRAILPRETTAAEISAAIEATAAGLVALHPDAVDGLLPDAVPVPRPSGAGQQTLTPREVEVLGMLAEGLGNKEIAWRFKISEHTVKFHISSIFTKLNASSRTEAVTLGIRQGLVRL